MGYVQKREEMTTQINQTNPELHQDEAL
ncbi:MAG: hypothetical protein JWL62_923, partial [Hyphomicrobiales bacterium]|nr:hypothetical protein [Hyphomicrobiales bacterium]